MGRMLNAQLRHLIYYKKYISFISFKESNEHFLVIAANVGQVKRVFLVKHQIFKGQSSFM